MGAKPPIQNTFTISNRGRRKAPSQGARKNAVCPERPLSMEPMAGGLSSDPERTEILQEVLRGAAEPRRAFPQEGVGPLGGGILR